jgi:hypothetical protein
MPKDKEKEKEEKERKAREKQLAKEAKEREKAEAKEAKEREKALAKEKEKEAKEQAALAKEREKQEKLQKGSEKGSGAAQSPPSPDKSMGDRAGSASKVRFVPFGSAVFSIFLFFSFFLRVWAAGVFFNSIGTSRFLPLCTSTFPDLFLAAGGVQSPQHARQKGAREARLQFQPCPLSLLALLSRPAFCRPFHALFELLYATELSEGVLWKACLVTRHHKQ